MIKDVERKILAIKLLHDNNNDINATADQVGIPREYIRRWKVEVGTSITQLLREVNWDISKVDRTKIRQVTKHKKTRKEEIESQSIETTIDQLKKKVLLRLDQRIGTERSVNSLSNVLKVLLMIELKKTDDEQEEGYLKSIMQRYKAANG